MTKELIRLDAEGSAETQESGVEQRPAVWRKASNGQIADGHEGDKIEGRLDHDCRLKTEMSKRNPLDILPMRDPVNIRPWKTDDNQDAQ
jgi:hypothetical protein